VRDFEVRCEGCNPTNVKQKNKRQKEKLSKKGTSVWYLNEHVIPGLYQIKDKLRAKFSNNLMANFLVSNSDQGEMIVTGTRHDAKLQMLECSGTEVEIPSGIDEHLDHMALVTTDGCCDDYIPEEENSTEGTARAEENKAAREEKRLRDNKLITRAAKESAKAEYPEGTTFEIEWQTARVELRSRLITADLWHGTKLDTTKDYPTWKANGYYNVIRDMAEWKSIADYGKLMVIAAMEFESFNGEYGQEVSIHDQIRKWYCETRTVGHKNHISINLNDVMGTEEAIVGDYYASPARRHYVPMCSSEVVDLTGDSSQSQNDETAYNYMAKGDTRSRIYESPAKKSKGGPTCEDRNLFMNVEEVNLQIDELLKEIEYEINLKKSPIMMTYEDAQELMSILSMKKDTAFDFDNPCQHDHTTVREMSKDELAVWKDVIASIEHEGAYPTVIPTPEHEYSESSEDYSSADSGDVALLAEEFSWKSGSVIRRDMDLNESETSRDFRKRALRAEKELDLMIVKEMIDDDSSVQSEMTGSSDDLEDVEIYEDRMPNKRTCLVTMDMSTDSDVSQQSESSDDSVTRGERQLEMLTIPVNCSLR
jgi:hypothetical protein